MQSRFRFDPLTAGRTIVTASAITVLLPSGCARPIAGDAVAVIEHLDAATNALARLEQQDAQLWSTLVGVILDIAGERLMTTLALDLDSHISPGGEPVDDALLRLTTPGESSVLANEIRTGRLTPQQAIELLKDFAAAQFLSPQSRQTVERQVLTQLQPAAEFEAQRIAVLDALTRQAALRVALIDEVQSLVDALSRAVSAPSRTLSPPPDALHVTVDRFVEDQPLAESINTLIDALMTIDTSKGEEE